MKQFPKVIIVLFIQLFVSNMALAQLSGTYTIGGSSPDYPNIQSAVNALNSNGISAPVEFHLRNGTYNDQVTVNSFSRSGNADDTVTFRKSAPGDIVTWKYTSKGPANNWVIKLDGAEYIIIRGMTFNSENNNADYGDIIHVEGGASDNIIEFSSFTGIPSSMGYTATANLILQSGLGNQPNHTIRNNTFTSGDKAIDFDYIFGGSDSSGLVITNNVFVSQNSRAIETGSVGVIIMGNTVASTTISDPSYLGIDVDDFSPILENNTIDMTKGTSAIWVSQPGGVGVEARIVNNLIAVRSSTASRGIYVGTDNVSVYHNTVRMRSSSGPALWIAGGSLDIRVNNNIIINDASVGGGLALRIDDMTGITSSNNDIYSTGAILAKVNNIDYNTLTNYASATGLDLDSVSKAVTFVQTGGTNDLHLLTPSDADVELLAPTLGSVTMDYDGDSRGMLSTFKGADEGMSFSALDNADTASGFYTIGGNLPDYLNPNEAIVSLKQRGMKGPVTFHVRAGSYPVHQTLGNIARSGNVDDLIFFRAANMNNTPAFTHTAAGTNDNWVIKIQDTNNVTFRFINFTANGASEFSRLIDIDGTSGNLIVSDSIMNGVAGITSLNAALIFSDDSGQDNLVFENNTYNNGSIALNMITANAFTLPRGLLLTVKMSIFNGQAVHGLVTNHNQLIFEDNEITNSISDMLSLYVRYNVNNKISRNKFLLTGSNSTAIELNGADGGQLIDPSIVANNFIVASNGLEMNTGSHTTDIYFNSIVASNSPISIDFEMVPNHSRTLRLINNILFNNGSGPALTVADDVDFVEVDYNNFINATPTLIDWQSSSYTSLAAYQAATGNDTNSTTTLPIFANIATADLHLTSSSINNTALTGKPVSLVDNDHDLDSRANAGPYMGADEVAGSPLVTEFFIGGTVSGLTSGSVHIDNINGDELPNLTNGDFTFQIFLFDTVFYEVMIVNQPAVVGLTCVVVNGSGNINGQNVTDIEINCNTDEMFSDGFE